MQKDEKKKPLIKLKCKKRSFATNILQEVGTQDSMSYMGHAT